MCNCSIQQNCFMKFLLHKACHVIRPVAQSSSISAGSRGISICQHSCLTDAARVLYVMKWSVIWQHRMISALYRSQSGVIAAVSTVSVTQSWEENES